VTSCSGGMGSASRDLYFSTACRPSLDASDVGTTQRRPQKKDVLYCSGRMPSSAKSVRWPVGPETLQETAQHSTASPLVNEDNVGTIAFTGRMPST
jgi:hypothetical protein